MADEMALNFLAPDALLLVCAVLLDGLLGDPVYACHPVRLMGATLTRLETQLRRLGLNGYGGGCLLFVFLAGIWVFGTGMLLLAFGYLHPYLGHLFHAYLLYSLIALRDLCKHGMAIEHAAQSGDMEKARRATSMLVGRDTACIDAAACRRAGMESVSENAVDGFVSPIFWYAWLGLPGIVLFKVISTMDSMVGFKTPRYFYFGWCGARLDDLLNYLPARFSYVLIVAIALIIPGFSARKALRVGWRQHGLVPGPNSGWSEAAMAGALQCRLIGPIRQSGILVTDIWLGDPADPPGGQDGDVRRTCAFACAVCLVFAMLAAGFVLYTWRHFEELKSWPFP